MIELFVRNVEGRRGKLKVGRENSEIVAACGAKPTYGYHCRGFVALKRDLRIVTLSVPANGSNTAPLETRYTGLRLILSASSALPNWAIRLGRSGLIRAVSEAAAVIPKSRGRLSKWIGFSTRGVIAVSKVGPRVPE